MGARMDVDEKPTKPQKSGDRVQQARDRFKLAMEAESELRPHWIDDLRFVDLGEQWPEAAKRLRETDTTNPRPCLVINKTQLHCRQVINDLRQNRPGIKAMPVDDFADVDTAEMITGLIRNIETVSDADIAYDTAVTPAVKAGIGYFRILTEIVDPITREQDIRIAPIWNPLCVYMDPSIEHPAGADAKWAFVVQDMLREECEEEWPDIELSDWDSPGQGDRSLWYPDKDTVRVAEYYTIEREEQLFIVTDQGTYREDVYLRFDPDTAPRAIERRKVLVHQCYWSKLVGSEEVERKPVPTSYIPIVRVAGLESVIDGKKDVRGMVRDMREPARIYNYWVTLNTEMVALAPKSPYVGDVRAFEGFEDLWRRANSDNLAYLPFNGMDDQGNPINQPQRAMPPQQSTALIQAIIQADNDLMGVAGRYEASLGEQGNEKSGRAIIARQKQGDNATFHFSDNLNRSLKYAGRVIMDMIARIYDTERVVRVLGLDGAPSSAEVNPALPRAHVERKDFSGKVRHIYNLAVGKYDVAIVAGPSYATKRQEAADLMTQLAQADPTLMQKAGDIIVKNYDIPGAEDLAKRLKLFLPPEVAQSEEGDDETATAVKAAQEQLLAQIDPVIEQMQQGMAQAEQRIAEAEREAAEKDMQIAELRMQLSDKSQDRAARQDEAAIKAESERIKAMSEVQRTETEAEAEIITALIGAASSAESACAKAPVPAEDNGFGERIESMAAQLSGMMERIEAMSRPRKRRVNIIEGPDGMPIGADVLDVMDEQEAIP